MREIRLFTTAPEMRISSTGALRMIAVRPAVAKDFRHSER